MMSGVESVELTLSEVVSLAVYFPAPVYVCEGFASVEVAPSPKVQE